MERSIKQAPLFSLCGSLLLSLKVTKVPWGDSVGFRWSKSRPAP